MSRRPRRQLRQNLVREFVETLAHRLALTILEEFSLPWVRLSVNKPGAIRGSKDVGVAVLRTRADLPQ